MEIRSVGPGLRAVLPAAVGKSLIQLFNLERPLTNFTWEDILHHTNNVFQLVARAPISRAVDVIEGADPASDWRSMETTDDASNDKGELSNLDSPSNSILHLKGQMMYMNEWDSIMFLGTPIMSSLDDMFKIGLYINDLSMHDSSRDLVLAGTQQSAELKLALDQEQEKSRLLEQSMIKLDQEMQRTDALLYQMIPKPVADRLRKGVPSVETCQVFDNVTILFSDVVGFTTICSQITPMEVVSMLNAMYTQFDQLSERHSVYKVETIGDAYMAVSGAPTVTKYHSLHMCDMALDMRASTNTLLNPSNNETMKIRIGVHTGTTVAGVVGIKMPRYCLFGDTVNTASRMETSGEAMKIHISETTKAELQGYPYEVQERGSIEVKGKGKMKTYWLINKKDISEEELYKYPFIAIMEEEVRNRNRDEHIENSRLKMDQPFSSSPVPYSPVSFKDIFEDRSSPAGRKYSRASRGSADGEALRLGATMTPRGSRASLPGCPFAMGLFGSFSSDSRCKSPDKFPVGKKNSVDLTISSACSDKDSFLNNKPEPCPYSAMASSFKVAQSGLISGRTNEFENDPKNTRTVTPSCPFLSSYSSSNDSLRGSIKTAPIESTPASHVNTTSCPSTGSDDKGGIPYDRSRVKFASSPLTYVAMGNEEKYSQRSPDPKVLLPSQKNDTDSDSAVALSTQSSPATNASTGDSLLTFLNNNEDRQLSQTNSQSGNGSLGHKTNPVQQDFGGIPSEKGVVNGTHTTKNELGCMSATSFQRNKLQKKSKTCRIL